MNSDVLLNTKILKLPTPDLYALKLILKSQYQKLLIHQSLVVMYNNNKNKVESNLTIEILSKYYVVVWNCKQELPMKD